MTTASHLARAVLIGPQALRALQPGVGEVAAVFRRSIYIRRGAALACIGAPEIGAGPLNVVLDVRFDWRTLVSAGERVESTGEVLRVGRVPLSLARAGIWTPPASPAWTAESVGKGLDLLENLLQLLPPPDEGLGCFARRAGLPHSVEAEAAMAPVYVLTHWLADPGAGSPAVGRLLGLGPGLTPSGDDFLAGVLGTLHALGRVQLRNRLWSVTAADLPAATGAVSRAHLECAAEGSLSEAQHLLLNAILGADAGAIAGSLAAFGEEDHTSPWDGLAGMACTLRAIFGGGEAAGRRRQALLPPPRFME